MKITPSIKGEKEMCLRCGRESGEISKALNLCLQCIRDHFDEVLPHIEEAHRVARSPFDLPLKPPQAPNGVSCGVCSNGCRISDGGRGYCGVRINRGGILGGVTSEEGNLGWYYDSLPTNCVADWVCPGGSASGYPRFSYTRGPEYGYKNLAVFYQSCSFDCLFCQNWSFRQRVHQEERISAGKLAQFADDQTSCICFFGGDPTPQLPHSLMTSRITLKQCGDRILRVCWETNGSMDPSLLREMAEIAFKSGGCIKFDLKAWNETVHLALCGVSNKGTIKNFAYLGKWVPKRPDPPFLIASTLLVPGYIDDEEIKGISRFIASLSPEIPYALLAFHPQFYFVDLPATSRSHALRCKGIAEEAGLRQVRIGNSHLLT
ncbi:MAG: radical SAM protein [Syntrophobacterales bacterium]|nr:MAG: radical SAM protein [Syntrophobacterales bacterium]